MATQRIISKQLGGVEDLLLDASGEPTVTQQRASGSKTITKIHSGTIPHKSFDGSIETISDVITKGTTTISTIEKLRALLNPIPKVWLSGYHTKGDGAFGSMIHEWDSSSIEDEVDGIIIKLYNFEVGRYILKNTGANKKSFSGDLSFINGVGTTSQNNDFTGAPGEVTTDLDKNTLIVHDGLTQGGHELINKAVYDTDYINFDTRINDIVNTDLVEIQNEQTIISNEQVDQDNRLNALETSQSAGTIGYATRADLDADLAHDENTIAIITNDSTPSNNCSYIKIGASGSGSWKQSSFDRVAEVENDVTDLDNKVASKVISYELSKKFMNRFNKNDRELVAGYINNDGVITLSGDSITDGTNVITPYIAVVPNEVLFLSQFASDTSLMATYDKDFNVSVESNMSDVYTVPDGVFYIKFSIKWGDEAYISSYFAQYFDYGYTFNDYSNDTKRNEIANISHSTSLMLNSSISKMPIKTNDGVIIEDDGTITQGVHPFNKVTKAKITVDPSSLVKFNDADATNVVIAEYGLNHEFLSKSGIDSTDQFEISNITYYILIGYYANGVYDSSTPEIVVTPAENISVISLHSEYSDIAKDIVTNKQLVNISKFKDTFSSGNSDEFKISTDTNGEYIVTTTSAAGNYGIFDILQSTENGERFQLVMDYELLELNCDSVNFGVQLYYDNHILVTTTLKNNNIGVRSTLTLKETTINSTDFLCGLRAISSDTKIDDTLDYYMKVKVYSVNIISYDDDFKNIQSIERIFGKVEEEKTKYISDSLYNLYSTESNFLGYNLVRTDNLENSSNLSGSIARVDSSVTDDYIPLLSNIPPVLLGKTGYMYIKIEVTLNELNADYVNLAIRMLGGDDFPRLTRNDIGIKKVFTFIRDGALSNTNHYFILKSSNVYTNGVANTSFNGGDPIADITINSYTAYASEKLLPAYNHASFFYENNTKELLHNYVKEPIQSLTINAFGDSITEHNYMKFIGCEGYSFPINIYGLRGPVSDCNGPTTGSYNFDMYNVMTDDADIIITMFGTHDFGKNVPLGTVGELDVLTYVGAYELLIQGLIEKYPTKLIIVCTPPPRGGLTTDSEFLTHKNGIGLSMYDYATALKALCTQYGIHCVDMLTGSGVNYLTMNGNPNLYNPDTSTDNIKIDSTGSEVSDNEYFTSDFIDVVQGNIYASHVPCYFAEYNDSEFIRLSILTSTLYLHPDTTKVKISSSKSEVIVYNTPIGNSITRFWFSNSKDSLMSDRIHPNYKSQRLMGSAVANVLKPILDARKNDIIYRDSIYNNAD